MKILRLMLLLIIPIITQAQNDYYVSTTGSNANDGSLANPWQTIQYGVNQLAAGDTLNILAGTYPEKIDIDVSGTLANYITIRNYQNDAVILDASSFSDDSAIIWTDNAYLRIQGLHLTNNIYNNASGLALQDVAHHIEIINNKISNIKFSDNANAPVNTNTNAVPLSIYADNATTPIHDILIKGNEVFNNQTGYSENIAADGNFTNFIIEDNTVHDNTNIGIDIGGNYNVVSTPANDHGRNGIIRNNLVYNCNSPYSTAAGIYIDGGWDIVVENNICHHNGYGGEIGCEENGTTERIVFRNNIFYNNIYAGMHLGAYDVNTTGNVLDSQIYNNTFYQNDTGLNYNGELILTQSQNCSIANNIFYISSQNVFITSERTQTNFLLDYNLVFANAGETAIETDVNGTSYTGLANYYTAIGQGQHSVFANPLFTDADNLDFHLQTNSAAIDAGDPNYSAATDEVDMDNQSRIVNNIIDCGADEYGSTAAVFVYHNDKLKPFPNPVKAILTVDASYNNTDYTIYNTLGIVTIKGKISSNHIIMTSLKKGIYFLVLKQQDKATIYKIIKE